MTNNTETSSAIVAKNVFKSFGSVKALDGVSLNVRPGTIFGLLGPNGAGKTTLVRIMTTLLEADRGEVKVAGVNVARDPAQVRKYIGLAGQYAAVDESLTGFENLDMVGRLYHLPRKEAKKRARLLLELFELADAGSRLLKTYSGGMRRRLDLAASLIGEPKVLFLDEPTTGLDPKSRIELWGVIKNLAAQGTTILLTTQYLEEADHLAEQIAVMNHGRVIAQGSPDELKSQIGGDVLELHLSNPGRTKDVVRFLNGLGEEAPQVDEELGRIVLPVEEGTKAVVEAIRILDRMKIQIEDIFLRRPTLDEVFLALTGKPAEDIGMPSEQERFIP